MESSNVVDKDDNSCNQNQACNSDDISKKTQEFLDSEEISLVSDPKLKRERQKLNELLESYKKLIDKFDSNFENDDIKADHEKKLLKTPEIYAILHPELYKNLREEEKKRLINKFSKRQFSNIDRIVTPLYRTPPANLKDARQEEKERLIKIFSSCPARFLNSCDYPVSTKKEKRSYSLSQGCFRNLREIEKERFSRILATTSAYQLKKPEVNHETYGRRNVKNNCKHLKEVSIHGEGMVRVGEYSPLTSKERGRTLFGYGEHEERRTQLLAERRKEYKHYLSNNLKEAQENADRALLTEVPAAEEMENGQRKSRCQSISTQTEDQPFDDVDRKEKSELAASQDVNNKTPTSPRQFHYLSPREKLMSDLHGVSRCFPNASACNDKFIDHQDIRLRQAAYAKALQEQIDEKKKLEELRRKKEEEEDELMEQRIRMQQEKAQSEVSNELKKKQDWIAQRQSQEEIMRRKMLEMKLEAQELRKQQTRKKKQSGSVSEIRELPVSVPQTTLSEPSHSRNFIKPQTTLSEPSLRRNLTGRVSLRNPSAKTNQRRHKDDNMARIPRLPERKFDPIDRAPLLEADRQNILSNFVGNTQPVVSCNPIIYNSRPVVSPANIESRIKDRERAEELLRAPLDFRIDRPSSPTNPVSVRNERSSSPPIPALRTRDIINNNTKVLEQKWGVPGQGRELNRTQANQDNILTQLGAFRRQLQQEHMKLEARLQKQAST